MYCTLCGVLTIIGASGSEPLCCDVNGDFVCVFVVDRHAYVIFAHALNSVLFVHRLESNREDAAGHRKEERLRRRRERERRARATETAEEREMRLARRRQRYREQRYQA